MRQMSNHGCSLLTLFVFFALHPVTHTSPRKNRRAAALLIHQQDHCATVHESLGVVVLPQQVPALNRFAACCQTTAPLCTRWRSGGALVLEYPGRRVFTPKHLSF